MCLNYIKFLYSIQVEETFLYYTLLGNDNKKSQVSKNINLLKARSLFT